MSTSLTAPPPFDPVIEAYKKDVDRSLLRERLRLTPQERVDALVRLMALAEEARRAGDQMRSSAK